MEKIILAPEEKAEYKKLQRQVQEASSKLFDKGNGGRIKNAKPNLYNNRLERIQNFCKEKGLMDSRWLKFKKLI